MIRIQKFTFNAFQENTYVLFDETKECVIIDPGCYEKSEQMALVNFIEAEGLKPVKLLNTHGHIDHVLGNYFVATTFGIDLYAHENTNEMLLTIPTHSAIMYGFNAYEMSPEPRHLLKAGDVVTFGDSELEVLFCPGHAPDHLVFYAAKDGFVINGDVLFRGSHGRTDLPGGSQAVLKDSIVNTMFKLPEETVVYTGHGGETTIGLEKFTNPILIDRF